MPSLRSQKSKSVFPDCILLIDRVEGTQASFADVDEAAFGVLEAVRVGDVFFQGLPSGSRSAGRALRRHDRFMKFSKASANRSRESPFPVRAILAIGPFGEACLTALIKRYDTVF